MRCPLSAPTQLYYVDDVITDIIIAQRIDYSNVQLEIMYSSIPQLFTSCQIFASSSEVNPLRAMIST
jgi:hypothetical protein